MRQEQEPGLRELKGSQVQSAKRKPYQKPAFRHERVFETMALQCGKTNNGVPHCMQMKKTS